MHLNEHEKFAEIDQQNMLGHIDYLPNQLMDAWKLGLELPLPNVSGIRQMLIAGMGGSAIGADLLASYVVDRGSVPVIVHRDYEIPAWAGEDTLVVCSSYSGNTEETLSVFEGAVKKGCPVVVIGTGGKLKVKADEHGFSHWSFEYECQPRAAVGYSFGLLLALYHRLGYLADPAAEVEEAIDEMKRQQERIMAHVPDTGNIAKRFAGQFMGRVCVIYAPGFLAPVGRRWKGQINEHANAEAYFEFIPEACHNTFQGIEEPADQFTCQFHFFLQADDTHPRNKLRVDAMKMGLLMEGIGTDMAISHGESKLAQMWTLLHFGDYVAYYLAILYDIDPTPVDTLAGLKASLS